MKKLTLGEYFAFPLFIIEKLSIFFLELSMKLTSSLHIREEIWTKKKVTLKRINLLMIRIPILNYFEHATLKIKVISLSKLVMKSYIKHFLWTILRPHSSQSCFEIQISWKVDREPRIDPPIHAPFSLCESAITLIFIDEGARHVISFCILSAIPGSIELPPLRTMFGYIPVKDISLSHLLIEL